ncbi:MAG: hypothetical protein ABIA04_11560 [Pseudomonadota bacterium]
MHFIKITSFALFSLLIVFSISLRAGGVEKYCTDEFYVGPCEEYEDANAHFRVSNHLSLDSILSFAGPSKSFSDKLICVRGTNSDDHIEVKQEGNLFYFEFNGEATSYEYYPENVYFFRGCAGNDILMGGPAVDIINGGAGNDSIYGGDIFENKMDIMFGGESWDKFFVSCEDYIIDVKPRGLLVRYSRRASHVTSSCVTHKVGTFVDKIDEYDEGVQILSADEPEPDAWEGFVFEN